MKNSKILSLLTAAALVVSSFAGLAISGGEAKAYTGTGTKNVVTNATLADPSNLVNFMPATHPSYGVVSPVLSVGGTAQYKITAGSVGGNEVIAFVSTKDFATDLAKTPDTESDGYTTEYATVSISDNILTITGKKAYAGDLYVMVGAKSDQAAINHGFDTNTQAALGDPEVIVLRVTNAVDETKVGFARSVDSVQDRGEDVIVGAGANADAQTYQLTNLGLDLTGYNVQVDFSLQNVAAGTNLRIKNGRMNAVDGLPYTAAFGTGAGDTSYLRTAGLPASVTVQTANAAPVTVAGANRAVLKAVITATNATTGAVITLTKTIKLETDASTKVNLFLSSGTRNGAGAYAAPGVGTIWNRAGAASMTAGTDNVQVGTPSWAYGDATNVAVNVNELRNATTGAIVETWAARDAGSEVTYTLSDNTYIQFVGYTPKSVTLNATVAAPGGVVPGMNLKLTDEGKKLTAPHYETLTVTVFLKNLGGAGVNYKGSVAINIAINPGEKFDIALIDENGVEYGDNIDFAYNNQILTSNYDKALRYISKTAGIDFGTGANEYTVQTASMSMSANNEIKLTAAVWAPVTHTAVGVNTRGSAAGAAAIAIDQYVGLTSTSANQKYVENTLTVSVTATQNTTGKRYYAVRTYKVTTNGVALTSTFPSEVRYGEEIDLSKLTVTYNGSSVTDSSKIKWKLGTGNQMMEIKNGVLYVKNIDAVSKDVILYYMNDGINTTQTRTYTPAVYHGITVTVADDSIEVGETLDLTASTLLDTYTKKAPAGTVAWSIVSGDAATLKDGVLTGVKAGTVVVRATETAAGKKVGYGDATITVTAVAPDPSEHYAGEPVAEDGVVGYLNEDLKTVTVTDVAVVSKAITIPATVQGFDVVAIDAQAFKKSDAKTVYVKGSVDTIGKGAFKASKVKKVYFYDPAALNTVGKNAFKKTNAKVVGVGAAFSDDAASQLKKAGASKVKNNGTAK